MDELEPRLDKWISFLRSKKLDFWYNLIPKVVKSFAGFFLRLAADPVVRNNSLKTMRDTLPALIRLKGKELFSETPITDIISIKLKLSQLSMFFVGFYYAILKLIPSKLINWLLSSKLLLTIIQEGVDLPTTMPIARGIITTFIGDIQITSQKKKEEFQKKRLPGAIITKKFLLDLVKDGFPRKTGAGMDQEGIVSVIVAGGIRYEIHPVKVPKLIYWLGGADAVIDLMMPAVDTMNVAQEKRLLPFFKRALPPAIDMLLKFYKI